MQSDMSAVISLCVIGGVVLLIVIL